jgi:hypothetical protein
MGPAGAEFAWPFDPLEKKENTIINKLQRALFIQLQI